MFLHRIASVIRGPSRKHPVSNCAALLFILLLSASFAAAGDPRSVRINEDGSIEILISSYTREEGPKRNVAADITVVTREEIEKIPATNLAEALQFVPGVYVEFNGGPGGQAVASIQGSSFSPVPEVAVYQDGVPLNMLANPVTNLSSIPLSSVERIEVYKGTASSAWGTAMGGVINIITREPNPEKPFTGSIQSSYGSFGTLRNSGSFSGTEGRLGYFVSFDHDQSNGFTAHTSYRQDAVYGKLNYSLSESSRLNFVVNHSEGRYEDPAALLTGFYPYWEEFHRNRTYERLQYEARLSNNITYTIEGRHQQFGLVDDHLFELRPKEKGWDYNEELYGISSRLSCHLDGRNHLVLGFDGDWGNYSYSLYSRDFSTGNWAMYANDTLTLGAFSLIGGLRYDNNIDFGAEVNPLVGAVYRLPWKDARIRAQVTRGFAAPPPGLIHDPTVGNEDLKAETALNYQLGAEIYPDKALKLELNFFMADIDDFINFDQAAFKWNNIERVRRQGAETRVSARIPSGQSGALGVSFGGTFVDVVNEATGLPIKDIPRKILDLSVSYSNRQFSQSVIGRFIDNNSSFSETRDNIFVFDYLARLQIPSPGMGLSPSIFFAVHNITDAPYLYRRVFPQPGRWMEGGLRCDF